MITTSFVYNEAEISPAYAQIQCREYLKLALLGVTVIYASGDWGVAGIGNMCLSELGGHLTADNDGIFNPSFPSSCPYVTSIGGTRFDFEQDRPVEIAWENKLGSSGGGFSNVFKAPWYQAQAIGDWRSQSTGRYNISKYSSSWLARGTPDLSINAADFIVPINGSFRLIHGTSGSAQLFGSIIGLINEERLNLGKSPIGFINPILYSNPAVFNDITRGKNPGCGTSGFSATEGWDPVTGLGSPKFPLLRNLLVSLP